MKVEITNVARNVDTVCADGRTRKCAVVTALEAARPTPKETPHVQSER